MCWWIFARRRLRYCVLLMEPESHTPSTRPPPSDQFQNSYLHIIITLNNGAPPSRRQTTPSARHRHDARPRPSHVRHRYGRAAAAGRITRGKRRLPRLCQSVVRHAARASGAGRQHALGSQNCAVKASYPTRAARIPWRRRSTTARVEAFHRVPRLDGIV